MTDDYLKYDGRKPEPPYEAEQEPPMTDREQGFREGIEAAIRACQQVSRDHLAADDHFGALKARIADNCVEAIRSLLPSQDSGRVSVPREPTEAMIAASIHVLGGGHINRDVVRGVYKAMLAAAEGRRG